MRDHLGGAGVVDQHVEPAVLGQHPLDQGTRRVGFAHVGLHVASADLRRHRLAGLDRGAGVHDDREAVGGQPARDLGADAGGAAGDEGDGGANGGNLRLDGRPRQAAGRIDR